MLDLMLDLTASNAGWCVFAHNWLWVDIPDTSLITDGVSTFEAQW